MSIIPIFTLFLNGIGIIRLQFYVLFAQALLFFPLAFLFYRLNFGLNSVVIPGIIFGTIGGGIFYIQYKKVINGAAIGVWNK